MEKKIITISRQYGSGGRYVGQKLSEKLGIPCYDEKLIDMVAKESGFAQDFVAGVISLQKLSEAMQLGKLGEQIVLKSPQAFEKIQYVKSELVDMQAYYIKKIERERATRKEYRMSKRQKADLNELFILDIMREGMENGDPRLF